MATYIVLINYTQQGIGNIKESPNRVDAGRELARTYGAEITDLYLTMGEYDLIAKVEAPSDDAMAKFALALGSRGNTRTKTLRAFTEQEFRDIIAALP